VALTDHGACAVTRARTFCTRWSLSRLVREIPYSTQLQ